MKKEEILKRAIEKAVENGWEELELWGEIVDVDCEITESLRKRIWITYEDGDGEMVMLRDLIFSHSFAKAFFSEKCSMGCACHSDCEHEIAIPAWQYHLQQMVLSPDPIMYLSKFI